ncbi:MAG: serine/threonine protein phosphatase [Bacteroidetes bacterium]|jgi:serine/threonine protein phosphatase 1|nr:serine/threonine protein phosphatase [Bacteroidota bacterium]
MTEKVIAIGDVHGCVKSLQALWKKLEPYDEYVHLFVGDYIDRGPSSKEVVDFLLEVKNDRKTVFLRGNHELMLLDSLETGSTRSWMLNGGKTTLESYGKNASVEDIPEEHIEFYRKTRLYYETEEYFFVHAGIPPSMTVQQSVEDRSVHDYFLWGREHLNAFSPPWEKTVVFGHTPQPFPIQQKGMIGIDTGCVYNRPGLGKLTCVRLPEKKFTQQTCLD